MTPTGSRVGGTTHRYREEGLFSEDWDAHRAATRFRDFGYNFGWPVRTLRGTVDGRWQTRTPAMAAGLTDHVWPLSEWLADPGVQRK